MAHFAQIDENGVVINVIAVDNKDITFNGIESEQKGIAFIESLGLGNNWVQTSYSHKIRHRFAGVGNIYDKSRDIFVEEEHPDNMVEVSWFGLKTPTSPSIMLDSAPRSANRWFNAVVTQAFPQSFQRWGYLHQHNPDTFKNAIGIFDVVATVVRNPLDSLASNLVAFNVTEYENIVAEIEVTTNILKEIVTNKSNVLVFKFEDVTANPVDVISSIGAKLGILPSPFDAVVIQELLKSEGTGFYSLPQDNQDELDAAKVLLSQPEFASYMKEATAIYVELVA